MGPLLDFVYFFCHALAAFLVQNTWVIYLIVPFMVKRVLNDIVPIIKSKVIFIQPPGITQVYSSQVFCWYRKLKKKHGLVNALFKFNMGKASS